MHPTQGYRVGHWPSGHEEGEGRMVWPVFHLNANTVMSVGLKEQCSGHWTGVGHQNRQCDWTTTGQWAHPCPSSQVIFIYHSHFIYCELMRAHLHRAHLLSARRENPCLRTLKFGLVHGCTQILSVSLSPSHSASTFTAVQRKR